MLVWPTGYGALRARPSPRTPTTLDPGQLSLAVADPGSTEAVACPGSVVVERSGGAETVGGCRAWTVASCVASGVLVDPAGAVHGTGVVAQPLGGGRLRAT